MQTIGLGLLHPVTQISRGARIQPENPTRKGTEWIVGGMSGRLKSRIRHREATHRHADTKSMLCLRGLFDSDLEFTGFITDCPFNPKHVSEVAVASFIE